MAVYIRKGVLVTNYEPHDLPGADIEVWRQVYGEDGRPLRADYSGPGRLVTGDGGVLYVQIGRESSTQLRDYRVDAEPTEESNDYDAGYRAGFVRKRAPTQQNLEGRSEPWTEGFMAGWDASPGGRKKAAARKKRIDRMYPRSNPMPRRKNPRSSKARADYRKSDRAYRAYDSGRMDTQAFARSRFALRGTLGDEMRQSQRWPTDKQIPLRRELESLDHAVKNPALHPGEAAFKKLGVAYDFRWSGPIAKEFFTITLWPHSDAAVSVKAATPAAVFRAATRRVKEGPKSGRPAPKHNPRTETVDVRDPDGYSYGIHQFETHASGPASYPPGPVANVAGVYYPLKGVGSAAAYPFVTLAKDALRRLGLKQAPALRMNPNHTLKRKNPRFNVKTAEAGVRRPGAKSKGNPRRNPTADDIRAGAGTDGTYWIVRVLDWSTGKETDYTEAFGTKAAAAWMRYAKKQGFEKVWKVPARMTDAGIRANPRHRR